MSREEIRRLNELKDKGIITAEEYERRKEKVLHMHEEKTKEYHAAPAQIKKIEKFHDTPNLSHQHHVLKHYHYHHATKQKSKILAGVLGIILGTLGIHNFYLGHYVKGMFQFFITVLSFGHLWWVSAVWGAVEGVLTLFGLVNIDAHGRDLK